MEGYNLGRGRSENEGKGTGNKKHKWQVRNRQGDVKNNMGNGEAKELVRMTHGGHKLSGGKFWKTDKGEGGKWNNSNTIINKIYFLKRAYRVNSNL